MNSLKDKYIRTETVIINMRGYSFEITGENITRYGVKTEETSPGCLVKDHFEPVLGCLYLAHLLKDCEVKEAMAQWAITDQKMYDEAPTLGKVLDALLKQISLFTDGGYDEYYEDCRIRHDGGDGSGSFGLPYEMHMQDIFWEILDLREGRYHGSGNIRYKGRRGIPRIETVGERIYTKLLDLIWRMDHGEGYRTPEEIEAWKRDQERINEYICTGKRPEEEQKDDDGSNDPPSGATHEEKQSQAGKPNKNTSRKKQKRQKQNRGKLLMDATVAPAGIKYPTDIDLLNKSREHLETAIDMCKYKRFRGHRRRAEEWLNEVKKREPTMFAHWALS